jgi:hypothetical protein
MSLSGIPELSGPPFGYKGDIKKAGRSEEHTSELQSLKDFD